MLTLTDGALETSLSTSGGCVLGLWWRRGEARLPLLRDARPASTEMAGDAALGPQAACFPLVPFGNRVRHNRFAFRGRTYALEPNTPGDPHYLHGDGWLSRWEVVAQTAASATMRLSHPAKGTPYRYDAIQTFALSGDTFSLSMTVTNRGTAALPFGIGWHPFFPMTPDTTLQAPARTFRAEAAGWMPGEVAACPPDLDFTLPRRLPRRWVNNGLEDWSGRAEIVWPEHGAALRLEADPVLKHAFIFVSDTRFDPAFRNDVFCFEPMSHRADGQNRADLGDLTVLEPGESLGGSMSLQPIPLHADTGGIDGGDAIA